MDLNKLKNYRELTVGSTHSQQRDKVIEEINEFLKAKNKEDKIHEGLDVMTVMYNYLFMIGMTEKDFYKHIKKLDDFVERKYNKDLNL